jgi:hypothetical protein
MINITITDKDFNKIKFLNPFQQLRIIRHSYSNYDQIITDANWNKVAIQFYKKVRIKYPLLANVASKWLDSKLTISEIR